MNWRTPFREAIGCVGLGAILALAACGRDTATGPQPTFSIADLETATAVPIQGPLAEGAVLGPSGGGWMGAFAAMPSVVHDGSRYLMYFVGNRAPKEGETVYGPYLKGSRIGLASSPDGVRWTIENDGEAVFEPGPPGAFDQNGVSHPHVVLHEGRFWMWYGGIDGTQGSNSVRTERLGLAHSDDGFNWTRANDGRPVLTTGDADAFDGLQVTGAAVLRRGDGWMMWYGAYSPEHDHTLMAAASSDGVDWTRLNGAQPVRGLSDAGAQVLGPSVIHDGDRYLMFYSRPVEGRWVMFAATSSDGIDWRPSRADAPVFPLDQGSSGVGQNHSVHPSQFLVEPGIARFWYQAESGFEPSPQLVFHGQLVW